MIVFTVTVTVTWISLLQYIAKSDISPVIRIKHRPPQKPQKVVRNVLQLATAETTTTWYSKYLHVLILAYKSILSKEKMPQKESQTESTNRPRNHLVTDATEAFKFSFLQYGKPAAIEVDQTAAEETWPGGALWDIGVLLSHVFVGLAGFQSPGCNKIPPRLLAAFPSTKDLSLLELGCGVGLTGIVAAAVLGTELTILTDLKIVVDKVAEPNMRKNATLSANKKPYRLTEVGKRGRIMTLPLTWGLEEEETTVQEALLSLTRPKKNPKKKKGSKLPSIDRSKPDIIVIGDVAYQHKPGAPSHFDALMSTVLKFLGPETLVVFGTRMRMPASKDLLELFLEYMDECVSPPVMADEIDPSFGNFKHQISVHVFKKK